MNKNSVWFRAGLSMTRSGSAVALQCFHISVNTRSSPNKVTVNAKLFRGPTSWIVMMVTYF